MMADTTSRKWVPDLSGFFKNGLDFEKFMIGFNYDNVVADSVSAEDLTGLFIFHRVKRTWKRHVPV